MISEQRIEGYELQGTLSIISTNNTNQNGSQDYNLKLD
jgi:hypothetical protein